MKGFGLRSLSKNFAATLGRQLLAGLFMLLATVIIARIYGAEGNGIYTVALLLPILLATFLNIGIEPANVYYLSSGQVSVDEVLLANSFVYVHVISIGFVLGAAVITWKSAFWFPGISQSLLWLSLLIFPINLMYSYLLSIFQGLQQFRIYNLILLMHPVLFLIFVSITMLLSIKNIAYILISYLAAVIISVFIAFGQLKIYITNETVVNPKIYIKKSINYGWKAHLSNILAFVNYKADIFLVNFFLGASSAGLYVIAVLITEKLWLISQAASTVLLPRLSQLSNDETTRKQLTPIVSRWLLMITFLISCLLGLVAYWLILFIFGSEYIGAVEPLLILIPGIVLLCPSRVLANDIAARGFPEKNMWIDIINVTCNIIGNIILIPLYGLNGAALATTIAYSLNLLLRLAVYRLVTGNEWYLSIIPSVYDVRYALQFFKKV